MKRAIALLACFSFLTACASDTVIKSIPSGAKVYVDSIYIGETPVTYSDSGPLWTKPKVTLKKDGYKDMSVELVKNKARPGAIVGAVLVLIPVLWATGFPEEVTYELGQ